MEVRATLRYNRQSPRKVRKVLNQVRGYNVGNAINYLHFSSEKASVAIEKTIRSAVANLLQLDGNNDIDTDLIKIKEAYVNQGPVMKRFRAASMGRASKLRRPSSHLTIILTTEQSTRKRIGTKTHPVGFRLNVNKGWTSTWFADKNNFAEPLEEDVKIRNYISFRLPNAGISSVEINRTSKKVSVTIHTARPGIVIGRGGEEVNKLKKELRQLTNKKDAQINISEVKRPELNAALVGSNIGQQLKKKISYRRVINKSMQATMRMGAKGIRINVAGRLGGVEIARSEKYSDGSVPLHTLRANIDYALTEVHTAYGIIGVKVWICKP